MTLKGIDEVHIVGIGGAGMSAIARVLHGRGKRVHGSDQRSSPITEALRAEGIGVVVGHQGENVARAELVLASSAVPDGNVELAAARRRGIPVARRPEFLATLTEGYDVIAVAGAHGKTTVTGMITMMLLEAGLDPTYIIGGVVANLGTNAHAGTGRYFIIEADEYRNTFLALMPSVAVVTNVEFDHPDCFADVGDVRSAFEEFVGKIEPQGLLVACGDDELARAIATSHQANGGRVELYGQNPDLDLAWRVGDIHPNEQGGVSFTVQGQSCGTRGRERLGEIELRIPGDFNAVNALAAMSVAQEVGIERQTAQRALSAFEGTARRFEVLGEVGQVTVIDDYAHHPTQIRGVLRAARRRYRDRRLVAVWEPHTFSRVRALYDDFMSAFRDADQVVILPIYAAREIDDGALTARDLAETLEHPAVVSTDSLDEAVDLLVDKARAGDVILMMGAGNEYIVGQRLVRRLRRLCLRRSSLRRSSSRDQTVVSARGEGKV